MRRCTSWPRVPIDLQQSADTRWRPIGAYRDAARALIASYVRDLGGDGAREMVALARDAAIPPAYLAELRGLARHVDLDELDLLVANLYYDALKAAIGCTAFAVDTDDGPLHARNLDWWSEDELLARNTLEIDVCGAPAGPYQLVGWPGFLGCLSGVAPGRFAVTLNAVLSDDPPALATAVVFVLRRVLETAPDFTSAVEALRATPLASDSLLLVTGTARGEMVVIERTPTRSALRHAEDGALVVTNDYRRLASSSGAAPGALAATSCGRFDRATTLLRDHLPRTPDACLEVLADPGVRLAITAQQMVLSARRGVVALAGVVGATTTG